MPAAWAAAASSRGNRKKKKRKEFEERKKKKKRRRRKRKRRKPLLFSSMNKKINNFGKLLKLSFSKNFGAFWPMAKGSKFLFGNRSRRKFFLPFG